MKATATKPTPIISEAEEALGISVVPHDEWVKWRKAWGAFKARVWKQLRQAERSGDKQAIIGAATTAVGLYDNGARLPMTIREVFWKNGMRTAENPDLFWPILIDLWDGYDWTAAHGLFWQNCLVNLMDAHKPCSGHAYLTDASGGFYADLPDVVTVYRGCARQHVNGIAWTTDIATAGFFAARGNTAADDPVIATGTILKSDPKFYFASQERDEFEIVCRPEIVKIEPQKPEMLEAYMEARQKMVKNQWHAMVAEAEAAKNEEAAS